MFKRVVVTGAQGFLGRHVVAALLAAGAEAVLGVGRSVRSDEHYTHHLNVNGERCFAPVPSSLKVALESRRYRYSSVDLTDADDVARLVGRFEPDAVIHGAAALHASPWRSLSNSNVDATWSLMEGLAVAGTARVVVVSSGSVYGGRDSLPFREEGSQTPGDLYGVTKLAGEMISRVVGAKAGMQVSAARVFNLVGPGLQESHLPAVLAARLVAIRRRGTPPVLELGPLHATRDFIDVRDAAQAIITILNSGDKCPQTVNVGSGRETSGHEMLELFLSRLPGLDVAVDEDSSRPTGVLRARADVTRLGALGHDNEFPLETSLSNMLDYCDQVLSESLLGYRDV